MKKFTRILALLLALALCLSFVACGDEEETSEEPKETRYTITEEEWEEFTDGYENVTIKTEFYAGDENSAEYVIKYADGYTCWCENEWSDEDYDGVHTHPNVSTKSSAYSSPSNDYPPYSSKPNYGGSNDYPPYSSSNYGGSNDYPSYSRNSKYQTTTDVIIKEEVFTPPIFSFNDTAVSAVIKPVMSMSIGNSAFVDASLGIGSASGWIGDDLLQLIYQFGDYTDADGEKYSFGSFSDIGSGCTKEYKGKTYYELKVEDEGGDYVTKWAEHVVPSGWEQGILKIADFEDLKFDAKEKAYVYHHTYKKEGISLKSYFYFEDGKAEKAIVFSTGDKYFGEEPYDLSEVTPKDLISDNYSVSIQTYKKHGETKIKGHSFSKGDIITKVKK